MKSRGFTLIETAIVLMIAGLLLASFLEYYTVLLQKQKYDVTRERMRDIRTALTIHAATNMRLPCPEGVERPSGKLSSPRVKPKRIAEKEDAEENDMCKLGAEAPDGVQVFNADTQGKGESKQVWVGILPVRQLRLNAEQGQDGWGNKFTYAVTRKLTLPDGMHGNPLPEGMISVVDEQGKNILDTPKTGRWVLVSHGPSGAGAFTSDGGRKRCTPKTLDGENCNGDDLFVIAPFSRKDGPWFFDDMVFHDDADAGGTILDKLITCNSKRLFYAPGETRADEDGCMGLPNVWLGACLQSEKVDDAGQVFKEPAITVLAPAGAVNGECACGNGLTVKLMGKWDDGQSVVEATPEGNITFTDAKGNIVTGIKPVTDVPGPQPIVLKKRTALFTCTQ